MPAEYSFDAYRNVLSEKEGRVLSSSHTLKSHQARADVAQKFRLPDSIMRVDSEIASSQSQLAHLMNDMSLAELIKQQMIHQSHQNLNNMQPSLQ